MSRILQSQQVVVAPDDGGDGVQGDAAFLEDLAGVPPDPEAGDCIS